MPRRGIEHSTFHILTSAPPRHDENDTDKTIRLLRLYDVGYTFIYPRSTSPSPPNKLGMAQILFSHLLNVGDIGWVTSTLSNLLF